jgi:chromosome segregation ATPase
MRTVIVESEVPEKLEAARARAFSAVELLSGEIAEIDNRIAAESGSIRALDHEYEYKVVPPLTFERRCEISELIQESKARIETMSAALAEKQSKVPAAAAALREAETEINTILKGALVPRIEAAEAELAQMEGNLESERLALGALTVQRREMSHAVSIGKEKREKLHEIGVRISESQNHVEGVSAAIEPARATLGELRAELRKLETKLGDAQNLRDIEKLKEKGARVAKLIAGKLKEASEALDSLHSLMDEANRFLPNGAAFDPSEVAVAAMACRMELWSHDERARRLAIEIAGRDAVERAAFSRRE